MNLPDNNLLVKISSEDEAPIKNSRENLDFHHFPAYAKFLLENYLKELTEEQLVLSRKLKLPLLRFFESLTDDEIIEIGISSTRELLGFCAQNKCIEYISVSLDRWLANQLPVITRNQVVAEDITILSLIRRRVFRHFLPYYTADLDMYIKIMDEVDRFTAEQDSFSFKTLLDIHQSLNQDVQALAHIGNWRWDLRTRNLSWSDEVYRIYELEPQSSIPSDKIASFNHPEDVEKVHQIMQRSLETALGGDGFVETSTYQL